jgi:large subunit ribosomal protein L15
MQVHELQPLNKPKKRKRIGRGGKRGNYSGRGSKGQKSRAGAKMKHQLRETINKFPKKRGEGFKTFKKNITLIHLQDIQRVFPQGGKITPQILEKAGLIKRLTNQKLRVKILMKGDLKTSYDIQNCLLSKKAEEAIIKAEGKVNLPAGKAGIKKNK